MERSGRYTKFVYHDQDHPLTLLFERDNCLRTPDWIPVDPGNEHSPKHRSVEARGRSRGRVCHIERNGPWSSKRLGAIFKSHMAVYYRAVSRAQRGSVLAVRETISSKHAPRRDVKIGGPSSARGTRSFGNARLLLSDLTSRLSRNSLATMNVPRAREITFVCSFNRSASVRSINFQSRGRISSRFSFAIRLGGGPYGTA